MVEAGVPVTRYFRWDFDVALVWSADDDGVIAARFVWDSDSQVATPDLLRNPSRTADYEHEVDNETRHEVDGAESIAEVVAALALPEPSPYGTLEKELADERAEVQRLAKSANALVVKFEVALDALRAAMQSLESIADRSKWEDDDGLDEVRAYARSRAMVARTFLGHHRAIVPGPPTVADGTHGAPDAVGGA